MEWTKHSFQPAFLTEAFDEKYYRCAGKVAPKTSTQKRDTDALVRDQHWFHTGYQGVGNLCKGDPKAVDLTRMAIQNKLTASFKQGTVIRFHKEMPQ